MNTIISDNIKETDGLNIEDVNELTENIKEDSRNDNEESSLIKEDISIISDEYFEKTCLEIDEMNFIEVKKLCQELKQQKNELENAKNTAESVLEMKKNINKDSIADQIELADSEVKSGIDDIESFLNSYDDTIDKLSRLIEKTEENIHKFDEVPKTTSYLSNAMIQILNKNIEKLNNSDLSNLKHVKIYYNEVLKIFNNRNSVEYIENAIEEKKISLRRLRKDIKSNKNIINSIQKNVTITFCQVFNVNQMTEFEKYILNLFDDSDIAFYFQYALYIIYNHEKQHGKYGKHKWVEVLIMNVLDISVGNYDLDGGVEYFNNQLLKLKDATINALTI